MKDALGVVRKLADSGSVAGRRDYALLLFYFLTGLRRSEVIGLRAEDLEVSDGALVIRYRRKGGKFTAKEVSDPAALEALKAYLGNLLAMKLSPDAMSNNGMHLTADTTDLIFLQSRGAAGDAGR